MAPNHCDTRLFEIIFIAFGHCEILKIKIAVDSTGNNAAVPGNFVFSLSTRAERRRATKAMAAIDLKGNFFAGMNKRRAPIPSSQARDGRD